MSEKQKLDKDFFTELYRKMMILIMKRVDDETADHKDFNLIIQEVKRLEVLIYEEDIEELTSFVRNSRGLKVIDLPLDIREA